MFTFGIGSGVSTELVKGIARAGNGRAEFVYEGERMQPKVPCCISYIHMYTYNATKVPSVELLYIFTSIHIHTYLNHSYSILLITSYCTLHRKDSLCTLPCRFCFSRKGGTGRGGWGHPQGAVHMAVVRFDCKSNMVGTGLANSRPGCMSRLRKRCSYFLGGLFLAGKASWAPSGCLPTESAGYCILVNE